jgi:hypothetical protein
MFVPVLSADYRKQLELLCMSLQESDLTWKQVLKDARRRCNYSSLTLQDNPQQLTGF